MTVPIDPIVFVPLTDPKTGTPAVARVDQIVAMFPVQNNAPGTVIVLASGDMNLLVTETPGEVLDAIASILRRVDEATS
jgi:hypothetical protein